MPSMQEDATGSNGLLLPSPLLTELAAHGAGTPVTSASKGAQANMGSGQFQFAKLRNHVDIVHARRGTGEAVAADGESETTVRHFAR